MEAPSIDGRQESAFRTDNRNHRSRRMMQLHDDAPRAEGWVGKASCSGELESNRSHVAVQHQSDVRPQARIRTGLRYESQIADECGPRRVSKACDGQTTRLGVGVITKYIKGRRPGHSPSPAQRAGLGGIFHYPFRANGPAVSVWGGALPRSLFQRSARESACAVD